jgi:hypothetical protein
MAAPKNKNFAVYDTKSKTLLHYTGGVQGPVIILEEQPELPFLEAFRKDPEKALAPPEPEVVMPRDWEKDFHTLERMANGHEKILVHMLEGVLGLKGTELDAMELIKVVETRLNPEVLA